MPVAVSIRNAVKRYGKTTALHGVSLDVAGSTVKGALYRSIKASDLAQPLKVTNTGEGALQAVVSVSGAPITPEPAAESGFKIGGMN